MYDELIKALRAGYCYYTLLEEAADAIEEMQTVLCNWCGVCPADKRDLSNCEIYKSCLPEPPKEEIANGST